MRVLIAPDKFKGSLTAREVAAAVAEGLGQLPGFIVDTCPVADGGEGFAEALMTRCERIEGVRDPLGRPIAARCGWMDATTAVIEMSDASGLHRLTPQERDPWQASTFGTGQLILHAASRGAIRVLVGLGGSATNDAGAGAAAALGWKFLTGDGEPVDPRPASFMAIERIEPPLGNSLPLIVAACDVRNPLLGSEGASRVYARQKGADDGMIERLEESINHLAGLVAQQLGIDHRSLPGAGAAGGLGYGLATFCRAQIRPGFALVSESLNLEDRVAASDLVITGEGRLDAQTLYGKAPAEVARLAKRSGKPVAVVCGQCELAGNASELFDLVIPLSDLEPSLERCFKNTGPLLVEAGRRIAEWVRRG